MNRLQNKQNAKSGPSLEELTGLQKAAVLLVALDQDTASKVMKVLPGELVEDISREVANTERIEPSLRQKIVHEFYNLILARQYVDAGGLPWARALLPETLPPDEARRVISAIEHQVHKQPFVFLQKTEK
jgi:flagellar motor switch protein FliG